jgi:hypothetical protein
MACIETEIELSILHEIMLACKSWQGLSCPSEKFWEATWIMGMHIRFGSNLFWQ